MKKFYKNKNFISIVLSVVLSFAFVAVAAYAATTIGTNVNTGGTLTVTGLTTLGNASTTLLSVSGNSYVGTVSSGTWNGTAIDTQYGGTGQNFSASSGLIKLSSGTASAVATSTLNVALSDTTGTLAVNRGGTGLTSYTINQLLYASGASTIGQIATSSLGLLTTDVAEGTNQYWTNTRFDNRLSATTTLPNITTLAGLTTVGTIGTGVWQGTSIADDYVVNTITASNYLPLAGGTLTGDFNVNGNATTTAATGNINTQGSLTIGAGTAITKHLSATSTLDFASIALNDCGSLTITVTGAALGDTVVASPGADDAGFDQGSWSAFVESANTVKITFCADLTAAVDLASMTWRADVWKH